MMGACDLPHIGSSNEYPQAMFSAKNQKNVYIEINQITIFLQS